MNRSILVLISALILSGQAWSETFTGEDVDLRWNAPVLWPPGLLGSPLFT